MASPDRQESRDLYTTPKAAAKVGICAATLRRYALTGAARPSVVLPSGRMRWSDEDIERLRGRSA